MSDRLLVPPGPNVPGKPGRRWVTVGYLPREAAEVTLRDLLEGLEAYSLLALERGREYRLAWDARKRRWSLSVR